MVNGDKENVKGVRLASQKDMSSKKSSTTANNLILVYLHERVTKDNSILKVEI